MKNATKYVEKLRSCFRRAVKDHKPQDRQSSEPLKALVRGIFSFDTSDAKADDAMKTIEKEFVDLNELRVATELELQELIGVRYSMIEKRTAMVNSILNNIFEREHTLNLERLKTISKRDARQFFRDVPDMHPFVEAYTMLFAYDGHSFPIDDEIYEYLKDEDVVDPDATVDEVQRFVEHQLKDSECHAFFSALRKSIFSESRKKKKTR